MQKFQKLFPRYIPAPIDPNFQKGLIALNTTNAVSSTAALPISGLYLSGVGALAVAVMDATGNQVTSFGGNILNNDLIDTNNSSTSTLLANATFTGTGTSTIGYSYVVVYLYSDQNSAANGVKIEFSSDNTNWNDATVDTFTAGNTAPNDGQTYGAAVRGRYYRVVYTNGSVNQTAFRLSTILRVGSMGGDLIPVADVPSSLADHAMLTKAAIMGKTTAGGGAWIDVKVNPSGALTVAATAADGDVFVRSNAAATFPVNAVQSGTWNITNISGTISLPTGAATAAKQPALGTAGTASADVITVQGIASMTALKVDGSGVTQPVSGTFWQATQPVSGTVSITANSAINVAQINGVTPLMGNGVTGTGSLRVTIASDNTAFAVNATLSAETTKVIGTVRNIGNGGAVMDGVITAATAPANGLMQLGVYNSTEPSPTTGQSVGIQLDSKGRQRTVIMDAAGNTRGQNVTSANAGLVDLSASTANSTAGLISVKIDQTTLGTTNAVTPVPASNSGWTFSYQSALSNTATQIKGTAGTFGGYLWLYNPNTAVTFIQVFNKASASVTLGTTTPDFVIALPGVASASATGSAANMEMVHGIAMGTGITVAATTTATGSTAPSAAVVATFLYK